MGELTPQQEIAALKEEREGIFASAQEISQNFTQDMKIDNVGNFRLSVARLDTLVTEFSAVQKNIIRANIFVEERQRLPVDSARKSFNELVDAAQRLYMKLSNQAAVRSSSTQAQPVGGAAGGTATATAHQTKLGKLDLPKFSGKIQEWTTFYNVFRTAVHENSSLSATDKFRYLVSNLKGEPALLVNTLNFEEGNYEAAWKLLVDRYNSERRHVSLHFNGLLDLPELEDDASLSSFLAQLQQHTHALTALKYETKHYGPLLATVILRKLSLYHRKRFEDFRKDSQKHPTYEELLKFMQSECARLDDLPQSSLYSKNNASRKTTQSLHVNTLPAADSTQQPRRSNKQKISAKHTASTILASRATNSSENGSSGATPQREPCRWCHGRHSVTRCADLLSMTVSERQNQANARKLCLNCLSSDHGTDSCTSRNRCLSCKEKHFSLLHPSSSGQHGSTQPKVNTLLGTANHTVSQICLMTVRLRVISTHGARVVRGLLDTGSQSTFLSTKCAKDLGLRLDPSQGDIKGMSRLPVQVRGHTTVNLASQSKIFARQHQVIVIDEITGQTPTAPISSRVRRRLKDLPLADPDFDSPGPIDVLIGADLYSRVVKGKVVSLGPSMPTAIETLMGYSVMGPAPLASALETQHTTPTGLQEVEPSSSPSSVSLLCLQQQDLTTAIQKFWQLEEPKPLPPVSPDDDPAEQLYKKTTIQLPSGRLQVRLPFKEEPSKLGDSKHQALQRFRSLERKFQADPQHRLQYTSIIEGYIADGILKLSDSSVLDKPNFFLPHHSVKKEGSSTTQLRIVFDASMRTSSGLSLNDVLHVGPKLLHDIRDVLFHFRRHPIVLGCDVKAMYHQFMLHPDDQVFHLLLWRSSESEPLQIYQITRVTFGVSSSAFLSIRSVIQLARQYTTEFPRAARAILEGGLYVDNLFFGADSLEDALLLQQELVALFGKYQLSLRKWLSNHPELLKHLHPDELEPPRLWADHVTSSYPVLGMNWIAKEDQFSYLVHNLTRPATKRGVSSLISSIFDPLGIVCPVVFVAKTILQQIWLLKYDWDCEVPADLLQKWKTFLEDLSALQDIRFPRTLGCSGVSIEIHGFCDASESGMSAVTYIRYATGPESYQTTILTAKTKISPLQRISLPRLELAGACLLVDVLSHMVPLVKQNYTVSGIYAWTDSTITLWWIRSCPHRLKTFVANRVSMIQETIPETLWGHVSSKENPADCASRGISARDLVTHSLWWNGPPWLKYPASKWPPQIMPPPPEILPEAKNHQTTLIAQSNPVEADDFFLRFSNWGTLQRTVSYVQRFIHNVRHRTTRRTGHLTLEELRSAERLIVRKLQHGAFSEDIDRLRKWKTCSTSIQHLTPFLDQHGLVRVGGRLNHAVLADNHRHPWILPRSHPVVLRLIEYYHRTYIHAGPQLLQSLLAQRYWILAGRSAIRSIVRSCIICFKARPVNTPPLMGDLPLPRVTPSRPFTHVGVDLAGPFEVKVHTLRFTKRVPTYLCVFVCFATKAAHLEAVQNLTADAFMAALVRFACRRGNPTDIYSDQGTNFVGASNELRKTYLQLKEELQDNNAFQHCMQQRNITFHFNPPAAPQQGGLWEAAVKSAKHHINRALHGHSLTFEEFNTLIIRVEAMLNSRPLTPASSDPSDLEALTPGHFLVGSALALPAETEHEEPPKLPTKRWHRVQAYAQSIWRRWNSEYLQTLQAKAKWHNKGRNLQVNDLVLVHDPSLPPLSWRMARVIKIHPGADNVVRVATVRTSTGELQRPVIKLYLLPSPPDVDAPGPDPSLQ